MSYTTLHIYTILKKQVHNVNIKKNRNVKAVRKVKYASRRGDAPVHRASLACTNIQIVYCPVDVLLMMRDDGLHMLEPVPVTVVVVGITANTVMEEVVLLCSLHLPLAVIADVWGRHGRGFRHLFILLG